MKTQPRRKEGKRKEREKIAQPTLQV